MRGMDQGDIDAIKSLQPYQDPASPHAAALVALAALSNLDKHQVILPTLMTLREEVPANTWAVTPRPDHVDVVVNRGAEIASGVELARARTRSGRPEMGVNVGFEMEFVYGGSEPPIGRAELRQIRSHVVGIVESFGPAFAA